MQCGNVRSNCDLFFIILERSKLATAPKNDPRKFKCSVCGRSFKQMSQLTNHVVASHLKKKRAGGSAAGAATVDLPAWCSKKKCDLCQKYFSDSKCLKKHVQGWLIWSSVFVILHFDIVAT